MRTSASLRGTGRLHSLRDTGMTQQAIADEVGLAKFTVNDICSGKQRTTEKPNKGKRDSNARRLYLSKDPATATDSITAH